MLVLALAIVAPQISSAFVSILGSSHQTIVICSGGFLVKVTVSESGAIVDDDAPSLKAPHCIPPDRKAEALSESWQSVSTYQPDPGQTVGTSIVKHAASVSLTTINSRGPPAV